MERTLLVAIDGSVNSSNSLDYIATLFRSEPKLSLHLISIAASDSGGKEWMHDVDPYRAQSSGVSQRSLTATRYLRAAEDRLLRCGFAKEQITTFNRSAGSVATAIRNEAERGKYDGLVVGRRGLGAMGNMLFGSVSGDLVRKCGSVPLWIVDGKVSARNVLLAVQLHPSSLLAADHLAFMLKNQSDITINLYFSGSMFGLQPASPEKDFQKQWDAAWCGRYLDLDNYLFGAHAQVLAEGGVSRQRIRQLPMRRQLGGGDLLRQAREHNCGTIIAGHHTGQGGGKPLRGLADRALKQAQNVAIWLVG